MTIKRVKLSKPLFYDFLISIKQIDHEDFENRGPETLESSRVQGTLIKVKTLNSLFRYFLIGINRIEYKVSENRGHETPGSILMAPV